MISILLPTRRRPQRLRQTIDSFLATSIIAHSHKANSPEIVFYIADDDDSYRNFLWPGDMKGCIVNGPRICFSDLWNACIPSANGDIFMLCADDVIFQTPGWDIAIENAFQEFPDKLMLAYADDGGPNGKRFASLPFVSRRWVEVVGYFTPPGFSADYSDTWPNDVAEMIGRKRYVDVLIEHMHPVWQKAPQDQTYQENQARWQRDRPDLQYMNRLPERQRDAEKLRKEIECFGKS